MPSFFAGTFAIAGLVAAAGPLIIHLLHRRRFRVIEWGAMDFLLQAVQRHRRILQIRDLLLLFLRTLCVVLFGLAMSRPFWASSGLAIDPDQPLHAVIVVDNSLSLSYRTFGGTLLDDAKARARDFIDRLPTGSRYSILPLRGRGAISRQAYRTREDALDALERIRTLDKGGYSGQALDLAWEACQAVHDMDAKRVVYIGDQQSSGWSLDGGSEQMSRLPELQIVQVAAEDPQNAWIESFRLSDAVADVETEASFSAILRYRGKDPRRGVAVTLRIDGEEIETRVVDLEPGQSREMNFAHHFVADVSPGECRFIPVSLSLAPDQLPGDDSRYLAVPLTASVPVVFIDEYGDQEEPSKSRYGETFLVRRLLAPRVSRNSERKQLIKIRHIRSENLGIDLLRDARLVVVAGLESPGEMVSVLREYVEQGGQLFVAAGGRFDASIWNRLAWLDGGGLLPAPISPEILGDIPEDAAQDLMAFGIDVKSLVDEVFRLQGASDAEMSDFYSLPFFFRLIQPMVSEASLSVFVERERERFDLKSSGAEASQSGDEESVSWLSWSSNARLPTDGKFEAEFAYRRPRVLARFDNGVPMLVERNIGQGSVLFFSSGLREGWNTLMHTNTVAILDRLLRSQMARTLERREFSTSERLVLPITAAERMSRWRVVLPDGEEHYAMVSAMSSTRFGVSAPGETGRGVYRFFKEQVTHEEVDRPPADSPRASSTPTILPSGSLPRIAVVNGPSDESDLRYISREKMAKAFGEETFAWVSSEESIGLEGGQVGATSFWKWLMAVALLLLIAEMLILLATGRRLQKAGQAT